jgi:Leucine-rich repeat (LRR) protein
MTFIQRKASQDNPLFKSPLNSRGMLVYNFTQYYVRNNDSTDADLAANATIRSAQEDELLQNLKRHLSNASFQELESPYSMQSLALDWLLNSLTFENYSSDRQLQRFALALFYFSTKGKSWKENQDWLSDDNECSWYQNGSGSGNVNVCLNGTLQILSLEGNALNGSLPNDIALLNSLTLLDLSSNALRGSVPTEISAISNLEFLDLTSNSVTGSIPSEIGALTTLEFFDLSYNSLTGSIPSEIFALTTLTELDLDYNSRVGSIPSEIGALTKLESLYLYGISYGNSLTGSIPSEIGALTTLKYLVLSYNSLTGSIPSEIGALTKLKKLYLSGNSLTGSIPESLCNQGLNPWVDETVTFCC